LPKDRDRYYSLKKKCRYSRPISLLINKDDIEKIRDIVASEDIDIIDIVEIDKNINQNRDKYC